MYELPDFAAAHLFDPGNDQVLRIRQPSGSSDYDDEDFEGEEMDPEELRMHIQHFRRTGGSQLVLYARPLEDATTETYGDQYLEQMHDESDEEEQQRHPGEIPYEGMSVGFPPEDLERMARLARLGFEPGIVAQVYEACGRDEALTQQCLMSGGFR
jgi:hypothetical protein